MTARIAPFVLFVVAVGYVIGWTVDGTGLPLEVRFSYTVALTYVVAYLMGSVVFRGPK